MNKKLNFAIEDIEFLDDANDSQFATASIEAFSSGDNLHDMTCTEEILRETAYTIYEKPVIFEVDAMFGDFGGHNEETTVPAGFIVPETAEFVKRSDGRLSLKIVAKIWKRYAKDFMDIFTKSADKNKSVSVEMEIYEMGEETESGMTPILSFAYTAITVLGDFVTPASPDANMQMISFSKERSDYKQAVRAEFGKYDELNFSITKTMRKNAKEGLELVQANPTLSGITAVAKAMGKYLMTEKKLSPDKANQIARYFSRKGKRPAEKDGASWMGWQLYGGSASAKLCRGLSTEMSAIDDELMAYFENHTASLDGGKEQNMKNKDSKVEEEAEVTEQEFETKAEENDDQVMMEDDASETKEDMAEEDDAEEKDMAEEDDAEEKDMAEEDDAEEKEDMAEEDDDEEEYSLMLSLMSLMPEGHELRVAHTAGEEVSEEAVFTAVSGAFENLLTENTALVAFKHEIESKRFSFEVEQTLKAVDTVLTPEEIADFREKSQEFSLETISGWQNQVKALAFENATNVDEDEDEEVEDDGFVRMGLPTMYGETKSNSIWQ